jgi:hypothetical protein
MAISGLDDSLKAASPNDQPLVESARSPKKIFILPLVFLRKTKDPKKKFREAIIAKRRFLMSKLKSHIAEIE